MSKMAAVLPLRPLTAEAGPVKLEDEVASVDPKLTGKLAEFLDAWGQDRAAGLSPKALQEALVAHIEKDDRLLEEIKRDLQELKLRNAREEGREEGAAMTQQRLPYASSPDSQRVTPTPPGLHIPTPGPIVAVNVGGSMGETSTALARVEKEGWGSWARGVLKKPASTIAIALTTGGLGWLLHYFGLGK